MKSAPNKILLLSIKPKYATKIFEGEKTIELRRIPPKVSPGDLVVVYVSSPIKAIWGIFHVVGLESGDPVAFWEKWHPVAGVTEDEYGSYFEGADEAHGIILEKPKVLPSPVHLEDLRRFFPGFHPPQLYRYLSDSDWSTLSKTKVSA